MRGEHHTCFSFRGQGGEWENQLGTRGCTKLVGHQGRGPRPRNEGIAWEMDRGVQKGIPHYLSLLPARCNLRWVREEPHE